MQYHIADFIIKIKNASLAKRRNVTMPYSKAIKQIGEILVREGFLKDMKEEKQEGKTILTATVKYDKRNPIVTDVAIVSKPSLRVYTKAKSPNGRQRGSIGIAVLTTNQGFMTAKEAKKKGVGGELLFRMW